METILIILGIPAAIGAFWLLAYVASRAWHTARIHSFRKQLKETSNAEEV